MATLNPVFGLRAATHAARSFVSAWNADSPTRRRRWLTLAWSPLGLYVDDWVVLRGTGAVAAYMTTTRAGTGDGRFTLLAEPVVEGAVFRCRWALAVPHAVERPLQGCCEARLAEDGRIALLVSRLERDPQAWRAR